MLPKAGYPVFLLKQTFLRNKKILKSQIVTNYNASSITSISQPAVAALYMLQWKICKCGEKSVHILGVSMKYCIILFLVFSVIVSISCDLLTVDDEEYYQISPAMEKAERFLSIDINNLESDIPQTIHESLEKDTESSTDETIIFSTTDGNTGEEIRVYIIIEDDYDYRIVIEKEYIRLAQKSPLSWEFHCQPSHNTNVDMEEAYRYWELIRKDEDKFSLLLCDSWIAEEFYLTGSDEPYETYADNWVYRADGTYNANSEKITMEAITHSKYVPRVDISEVYDPNDEIPYEYTIEPLYSHSVMMVHEGLNFLDLFEDDDLFYDYIKISRDYNYTNEKDDPFFVIKNGGNDSFQDDEAYYIGHAELDASDTAILYLWGNRFEESGLPPKGDFELYFLESIEIKEGTEVGTEPDGWSMKSFELSTKL